MVMLRDLMAKSLCCFWELTQEPTDYRHRVLICVLTYVLTCVLICILTCVQAYVLTCVLTYVLNYILTSVLTEHACLGGGGLCFKMVAGYSLHDYGIFLVDRPPHTPTNFTEIRVEFQGIETGLQAEV